MSGRWVPACRPFRRLLFRTAMSADPGTISESDRVTSAVTRSNTSCRRAYRSVPVSIASTFAGVPSADCETSFYCICIAAKRSPRTVRESFRLRYPARLSSAKYYVLRINVRRSGVPKTRCVEESKREVLWWPLRRR